MYLTRNCHDWDASPPSGVLVITDSHSSHCLTPGTWFYDIDMKMANSLAGAEQGHKSHRPRRAGPSAGKKKNDSKRSKLRSDEKDNQKQQNPKVDEFMLLCATSVDDGTKRKRFSTLKCFFFFLFIGLWIYFFSEGQAPALNCYREGAEKASCSHH